MRKTALSIFDYADFRDFLKAYIEEQKAQNPKFSYQYFSDHLGLSSKSVLHKIVKKSQKQISAALIMKIADFLVLNRREADYFETLVAFNLSDSPEDQSHFYERLQSLIPGSRNRVLQKSEYDYFSKWYLPVLRELVCMQHINATDYVAMAKLLDPPIKATELRKGIESLLELNLIQFKNGKYVQTEAKLHSGENFRSVAIWNFQRKTADLASRSLTEHSTEKRDISTMTFGVDEATLVELKKKMAEVRLEIAELVAKCDNKMDRVMQLNLQLFPLSRSVRGN